MKKKNNPNKDIQDKIQTPNTGEEISDKEKQNPNQNQKRIPPQKIVSKNNINQTNDQSGNNNNLKRKDSFNSEDYLDHPKPLESDYYDDEEKEDIREIFNRNKISKSQKKKIIVKSEKNLDFEKLARESIDKNKLEKDLKPNLYKNKIYKIERDKKAEYSNRQSHNYINNSINNTKINYNPIKKNDDKKIDIINENVKKLNEEVKQIVNKSINNKRQYQVQNLKYNFGGENYNINKNKNISAINKNQLLKIINEPIINKSNIQNSFGLRYNNSKIYEEEAKYISNSQPKKTNNEKLYKNIANITNITNSDIKSNQNVKRSINLNKNFNLYQRKISYENANQMQIQNIKIPNNNNYYYLNRLNSSNRIEKNQIPVYAQSQKYINISRSLPGTENNTINNKNNESESNSRINKVKPYLKEKEFNNVQTTCIFYSKKEKPQKLIKVNRASLLDSNKNVKFNIDSNALYLNTPIKKNVIERISIKSNQKPNITNTNSKKHNENPFKNSQFNSPNSGINKYVNKTVFNQYMDNKTNKSQITNIPLKKHFNYGSLLSERSNKENILRNCNNSKNNINNIKSSLNKRNLFFAENKTEKSTLNTYHNVGTEYRFEFGKQNSKYNTPMTIQHTNYGFSNY